MQRAPVAPRVEVSDGPWWKPGAAPEGLSELARPPRWSSTGALSVGPLEVLVVECPGERVDSDVIQALSAAVDSGTLRIVDVTFLHKDAQGALMSYELAELEEHDL